MSTLPAEGEGVSAISKMLFFRSNAFTVLSARLSQDDSGISKARMPSLFSNSNPLKMRRA